MHHRRRRVPCVGGKAPKSGRHPGVNLERLSRGPPGRREGAAPPHWRRLLPPADETKIPRGPFDCMWAVRRSRPGGWPDAAATRPRHRKRIEGLCPLVLRRNATGPNPTDPRPRPLSGLGSPLLESSTAEPAASRKLGRHVKKKEYAMGNSGKDDRDSRMTVSSERCCRTP